jgi:hypothetical protein
MHMQKILIPLVSLLVGLNAAQILTFDNPWAEQPMFTVLNQSSTGIEIVFSVHEIVVEEIMVDGKSTHTYGVPGIFLPNEEGAPNIAGTGRYIAIPEGAYARATIVATHTKTYRDVDITPSPRIPKENEDTPLIYERNTAIYNRSAFYPATPVQASPPMKMRGVDVIVLGVTPFQYNPVTRELIVYQDIRIRVDFIGGNGHFGEDRLRSRFWEPILEGHLLNYESLPTIDFFSSERIAARDGYEYIIIVPDDPLFEAWGDTIKEWRKLQGISCDVFTLSEVGGSSSAAIENFLNNAYNTWNPAPVAFLLLSDYNPSGDEYGIISPLWSDYCASDNIYADVNGNNLPDMHHGRITAQNEDHLATMVNKLLSYERNPYTDAGFFNEPLVACGWQTDRWFQLCSEVIRGFFINSLGKNPARQYNISSGTPVVGGPWSTAANTSTVVNYFYNTGYLPSTTNPHDPTWWSNGSASGVNAAINSGAFMVQHRDHGSEIGWGEPSYENNDLNFLTNTMYTFVNSSNCLTGKFNWSSECFAEKFHRIEYGALGLNAATEVSYSFVNDTYVWGMFDGLWSGFMSDYPLSDLPGHNTLRPSMAMTYGKYFLYSSSWPYNPGVKTVTFHLFNHHGDCFTTLYSEMPQHLTVTHDIKLIEGDTLFAITANDSAIIALTVNGEIIGVAEGTGSPCNVVVNPQISDDIVKITITKANYYRYVAEIPVVPTNYAYIVVETSLIDDSGGDGIVNPGENVDYGVYAKNLGTVNASGVYGLIATADPYVSVSNDSSSYGIIVVNDSVLSSPYYGFIIANNCPDGHVIEFDMEFHDVQDTVWTRQCNVAVHAPVLSYYDHIITEGIGVLYPGQTADLVVTLENEGSYVADNISATIITTSPYIVINDASSNYGTIDPGATGDNSSDPYNLTADSATYYGTPADFSIIVQSGVYIDTINFTLIIGRLVPTDTGYYYAYFPGGPPSFSPTFNWYAIDSTQSTNPGVSLDLDRNETVVIDLPFTFTYYGIDYDRISISPNGWIAMDSTDETGFANNSIPNAIGPPAMIAGLWDYLEPGNPGEPSDVYYYYDVSNHRFIVEYFMVEHYPSGGSYETFEIILYDPAYYPTPTGDGEIMMQYLTDLQLPGSATVGIENESETVGVEYYFNGIYDTLAIPITDSFAIKYTTHKPGNIPFVEELETFHGLPQTTGLSAVNPNPFVNYARISYHCAQPSIISLEVYDVTGRVIRQLAQGVHQPGSYRSTWDARDEANRLVPAGVYFIRFISQSPEETYTGIQKMILIK